LNNWIARAFPCFSIRMRETVSVTGAIAPNSLMTPVVRLSSVPRAWMHRVAKRFVVLDRIRPGKEMLVRVVAMLTRLIDRFDTVDPLIRKD
jgi:hypothetical protein